MAVAQSNAAHAVAEYLRSADDLNRLSNLRKKLTQERVGIEAKLKSGAKEQLDATRDGLAKLRETKVAVGQVREEMVNVERLCEDPKTLVEGFSKVAEVAHVHRRFVQTIEMVNQLRDMYDKIDALEALLAVDRADPLGPATNLLTIHFHLTQLEAFRNETVLQAKRATLEARATLESYFARLHTVLESFEAHYLHLAGSILDIIKAKNSSVAVKIAKIAQVEGSRDEKAIAIRLVKRQNMEMGARFKSMQADARVIKHYRAKVLDAIRASAKNALQRCVIKHQDDLPGVFDDLDWFYQDLLLVEDQLISRFPPDWKIHTQFVKAYHKALYDWLKTVVDGKPDAATCLRIAQFTKEYKKNMTKELEIPTELLVPNLVDGKEQELIDEYLKLIITKLDEWAANLMKTELEEFEKREQPPDEDTEGLLGMQGAVIMFQMVNQQVDAATDSGQGAVLARVVEESSRVMRSMQAQWMKHIDVEYKKQVDLKPELVPPGLVEYVIALANDQVKNADSCEALTVRLADRVSEKYQTTITDKLNQAMDGYLDVGRKCVATLIDIVFSDLKPAYKALFTADWYVDERMKQIIETIADYMADYQAHLNPNLFNLLLEDIIDTFLIAYLIPLRKASKLKMPAAATKMRDDVRKAMAFFSRYKPEQELEGYFDVLESIITMLTASQQMVFLDFYAFAKKYGPQLQFVESIMRARDDLDRAGANDVMERIRTKVKEEGLADPEEPTIFHRLPK